MSQSFSLQDHSLHGLSGLTPPWEFLFLKNIDSTNNYAKENVENLSLPTMIMAEHQTKGRGRGQNSWEDQGEGRQFLSTWVTRLNVSQPDPRWTMAVGYFVYASLHMAWPKADFSIKAPNDIYIKDKKCGGLLIETTNVIADSRSYVCLFTGFGLNVFSCPHNLEANGTSLASHIPALNGTDWEKFVRTFAKYMGDLNEFISGKNWLANIESGLVKALNQNIHHRGNPVKRIEDNGSLILDQGFVNWLEL